MFTAKHYNMPIAHQPSLEKSYFKIKKTTLFSALGVNLLPFTLLITIEIFNIFLIVLGVLTPPPDPGERAGG